MVVPALLALVALALVGCSHAQTPEAAGLQPCAHHGAAFASPCLPASATPSPTKPVGIAEPDLIARSASVQASQLAQMKAIGITSIRLDADWSAAQPTGPTTFNWVPLDRVVKSVLAAGMTLDLIIDGCPAWAAAAGTSGDPSPIPASPAQYATFAAQVAARYGPQGVKLFEIWNEPNNAQFWANKANAAAYTADLKAAYAAWPADEEPTDEAMVVERAGGAVALVPGDPALAKLTFPEDFAMAELIAGAARTTRIGQGIDAHRFGPGDAVMLCGVAIPHDHGLVGHSDADAGLHAITDALLGAIGEGDIGDHFPPTDPQWRGAASDVFLRHAADLVASRGGRILNVDVTLVCERPKIKPHRAAMRQRLAELLGLGLAAVSVKATTMEGMGFTGREEGLLAQAVAMVELPA